ncbi:MAG TPA: thiamine pyrophosphate-dependent enzyme, partial [Armatimonadota bacterium]|nr:thiamine pyrophosphate-dependent enzyme [Armatimonadota bacterium]
LYRDRDEVEEFRECCDPIEYLRRRIIEQQAATPEELGELERRVHAEIDEAVRFAEESSPPPLEWLYEDIYVKPINPEARKEDR